MVSEPSQADAPSEAAIGVVPPPEAALDAGAPASEAASRLKALTALEWLPTFGRASALFALIGFSLVLWAQTAFQAKWVKPFVLANELEPAKRKLLLLSLIAGAVLPVIIAAGVSLRIGWRGGALHKLERFAWLLSPLIVVGALPVIFRHQVWVNRAMDLLVVVALLVFILEGTVRRALLNAPDVLIAWTRRVRDGLPSFVRTHAATITVWIGVVGYSYAMTVWCIMRHRKLQSAVSDLGISDNLMYNGLAGRFMESPIFSGPANGLHFLANHFQIGQFLFLPIYALAPRAETLLAIQSVALGVSAVPLYYFARRRLSPWMSALLSLAFLAYYPMHGANLYEMTYLPVACPFILGTIWALDAGRFKTMIPIFVAALLMREDISFGLAITATVFAMAGHQTRAAFVVALVSTAYFLLVRFVIMPAAGTWVFPEMMYRELIPKGEPNTFGSVIKTLVTNPIYTLGKVTTQDKLVYLLHLLVPLAFLPIRRAWLWAAILPGTITTMLTTAYKPTISLGFHYTMLWTPYLWLAVPVALALLGKSFGDGPARMRAAFAGVLFGTAALSFNFGAFARPPNFMAGFHAFDFKIGPEHEERYRELRALIEMMPADASVSLTEIVGAHAANRVNALSMLAGPQDADYILVRKSDRGIDRLRPVLDGDDYGVLERRGEFALLKKGHDPSGNAKLRKDFGL